MLLSKLDFCRHFVNLNGEPISFAGRPYLPAVYAVNAGNLVIRASRQVEKSTFLANTIAHECCRNEHAKILVVLPREEQAHSFFHDRLLPILDKSPILRRALLGKGSRVQVNNLLLSNGATIKLRPAFHNADACRGQSATMLIVDELQDLAPKCLAVLKETLSHARAGRMLLSGTPKLIDNDLETIFSLSTANLWTIPCVACGNDVTIDERCLGPLGLICPRCQSAINAAQGRWVATNPGATWGQGFCISHPMVPWIEHRDLLERMQEYDLFQLRNEVLGLSTTLGEHAVTMAELEDCCQSEPMWNPNQAAARQDGRNLIAGVDWGGGTNSRTVLVIGELTADFVFHVRYVAAFRPTEDPLYSVEKVAQICRQLRVSAIAADSGMGLTNNRLLFEKYPPPYSLYAITYAPTQKAPTKDGHLMKWTVDRTVTLSHIFTRVRKQTLRFPPLAEMREFLPEFACVVAVHDAAQRSIKFTHAESQRDDTLHATNYAILLAVHARGRI
jgi:hypothetical protein